MSKLLSLSNSNSKNNSYNANGSKENKNSREILKKKNFSYGSFNKSKGGEISSGNGSIESNNANITNINNSNSNNTNSNSNSNSTSNNNANINGGQYSKNSVTAKRKKFYDKLMKKDLTKKSSNKNLSKDNNIPYNLNKVYDSDQFDSIKNVPSNQSASSNIKITNNTNIILNVKSGTKSLDIRALNNNTNKDLMMRDMRELHIITKKAICSISTINPLLDTLDNFNEVNKQRNYSNNKAFNKKPMTELLINDNTDFSINQLLINNLTIDKKYNYMNNPNININFNNNKQSSSQIINIININGGNYSMDQTKKIPIKNIPRTDLSSIKECVYDTQYMSNTTKPPQKKGIKFQQHEIDTTNNFNNIKQCKTKVNKINKLPNKKYSHNNWNGNINNTASNNKVDNNNINNTNKIVKKYIEHLRTANKTIYDNSFKRGTFIDINKSKNK
jgi:hypothetical protein